MFKAYHAIGLPLFLLMMLTAGTGHAETLRDPTLPLGHTAVSGHITGERSLRLQSVLVSNSRRLAFINGQSLREQDIIKDSGATRVVQIDAKGVVLQRGAERWRLNLDNHVIRQ